MKISIEHGVPLPTRRFARNSNTEIIRKTLAKLKPGQSFFMDAVSTLPYRAAADLGVKITTRKTDNGMRVWRKEKETQNEQTSSSAPDSTGRNTWDDTHSQGTSGAMGGAECSGR